MSRISESAMDTQSPSTVSHRRSSPPTAHVEEDKLLAGTKREASESTSSIRRISSGNGTFLPVPKGSAATSVNSDKGTPTKPSVEKVISSESDTKLSELRVQFLKGFIGDKLQAPLPKCPIECMFWDWIYSYYPDNDISPLRFVGFTRDFVAFLLDNKRFSQDYGTWIQQNADNLIKIAGTQAKPKPSSCDVKIYADMLLNSIKESLNCAKPKTVFPEYAVCTVNKQAPKLPDDLIATHSCSPTCGRFAVGHLITFQHREFLRNNFSRLFAGRWTSKKSETEVLKPIGKASTNPTISKLKLAAKISIEDILKSKLPSNCSTCGTRIPINIKEATESLASVISQSLDKAHEATMTLSCNLFK